MAAPVLLLCQDLIFTTKIVGTAKQLGRAVQVVPNSVKALEAITAETQLVLVDLSSPASTSGEELTQLRQALSPPARLIAYGSHVDVERLRTARKAGCDPVLARSEFTELLAELLSEPA